MTRSIAPLKKAEDAVEVDTSHMTIQEVADTIIRMAKEKMMDASSQDTGR